MGYSDVKFEIMNHDGAHDHDDVDNHDDHYDDDDCDVYPHLAKSSADSIGLSIRSTVRNAA